MGSDDIYSMFTYRLLDFPDNHQKVYINSNSASVQINTQNAEMEEKNKLDKMIKSITVNKEKRIVTVVFDDKDVKMSKCSENDEFDINVGVAICMASHLAGSKSKFKSTVEDKQRKRK